MEQMTNVEKMLRALLKKDNLIHWIGGYVYGRTSNDDPFIVLYPAQEYLKEKAARVYEHDFKKLPDFVNTAVPAKITNDGNPSKDKARRMGIYIECPAFEVLVFHGKETQMGPEIRFSDVLRVTSNTQHYLQDQAVAPQTAVSQPQPQPQPKQPEMTSVDMWLQEAQAAREPLMFDGAIVRLRPYFKDATTAAQFREVLFPGGYDPRYSVGFTYAMMAYADGRTADKKHDHAKVRAYDAFRAATTLQSIPVHLLGKG